MRKKIYVITGSESSGKSTLADQLSVYYQRDIVPEYSRKYLEEHGPHYSFDQVLDMAKGQIEIESEILSKAKDFIICDTDLLTYKIWYEFKYGINSDFVESKIDEYRNRHYFLCSPDFQWKEDQLRENPNDQWEIFELYKENLLFYNFDYTILEGDELLRFRDAISIIGQISK